MQENVTFNVTGVANCTDDPSLANISAIPILSPPSPERYAYKHSACLYVYMYYDRTPTFMFQIFYFTFKIFRAESRRNSRKRAEMFEKTTDAESFR